jgi:regulator of sigma E protease
MSVLYFLLFVGVLVLFHELGHFVAAKLLDVKVLRFSIGYGRPLVRVKLSETEYQIAIIPIGGYTRILGIEDDEANPADAGRSFAARPLWQRLVIVFAGPAANLILPVAIYFLFFAGHTVLPAAVIGDVLDGGPAARAGFEPGDRIVEINGQAVRYWEEVEQQVHASPGKELHFRIARGNKVFERYLTPVEELVRRREGEATVAMEGRVGVTHAPFIPLVGIIDEKSPAWKAGLRTQDLIISVGGQPMRNWNDVLSHLGRIAGPGIVYFRGTELPGVPQIQLLDARHADLTPETIVDDKLVHHTYTGLERAEMFVAHVDPGSPADSAGLRPGDLITALDDRPVTHWMMELEQRLLAEPTKTFKLTWRRAATTGVVETMSADLTQVYRKQLDAYGHTLTKLVFGARNDVDRGAGVMIPIEGRMGYALSKAVARTGETISAIVAGFISIISGESPSDVGGPLMMYRVVSVSGNEGLDSFLLMLALISVNLGLINLLPVPMLDGGHLMFFVVEAVRRRPLTPAQREKIQRVGLGLIVLIMILASRNDVMRGLFH